ncbi:MAG: phosphoglycerate dehydrogenase [Pirellulales bacterium]
MASRFGPLPLDLLIVEAKDCDAIIAATDPYHSETFAALPRLKLVARCGVGIDSVDLKAATEAGVTVTNVPHAMTDAVADYCIGLLLTAVRRIHEGFNCMTSGGWTEYPGVELRGKVLGLIGFGKIGQAVADRAVGFGLKIIVHDPIAPEPSIVQKYSQIQFVSFDELLATSDFISIHAPNIASTKNLINAVTLAKMKPGNYLINTSRGALINEADLIQSLTSGHLGGAAIDVYCQEPLPADHALRNTPRLLLTPHNAFNSREAAERMSWGCAQPIMDLLDGKVPEFVCNRDILNSEHSRVKHLLPAI